MHSAHHMELQPRQPSRPARYMISADCSSSANRQSATKGFQLRLHSWVTSAVLTGVLSACAPGLRSVPVPPAGVLPPGQTLEIWRGSQATTLHAVVVTADSLSGISISQPSSCDSCRMAMPLTAIDSVLEVNGDKAGMATFGLTAGLIVSAFLLWRASAGN